MEGAHCDHWVGWEGGGVGAYILKFVDVLGINQNKLIKKKEREREAASINSTSRCFPSFAWKAPKSWETFTTWQLYTFLNDLDIWHSPFSMRKGQRSHCKLFRVFAMSRFHILKFLRYNFSLRDAKLLVRPRAYFY